MSEKFDAVVVGSGFGGSITACRLAEKGMKVLVLERGRRWTPGEYPRKPGDAWTYDVRRPERHNGWLDLRFFKRMIVAQGAGANVLGSPLLAAQHLLNVLNHQRRFSPVQAGEIVTTGTLLSPPSIYVGETWVTRLSGIDLPGLHLTVE